MPPVTGQRPRGVGAFLLALFLLPFLALACDSPPQILEITPSRGARDVPTNAPIRIRFDRKLDRQSVEARFSIHPRSEGRISWENPSTLVFQHSTLDPRTQYQVVLSAGYRDANGNVNGFNHSWTFQTEPPPDLKSASPAPGESLVDPATYLSLAFSREMDPQSFRGAVTFSPSTSFAVQGDPSDAKTILIAPRSLLATHTSYQVSISAEALDADGNRLAPMTLRFTTGSARPLTRFMTFIASDGSGGPVGSVWMVDDAGFPRILEDTPAADFSWSPDGSNLLVQHPDRSWTDFPIGSAPTPTSFTADWAAYLGPRAGYVFLDHSRLVRLLPTGEMVTIAEGVGSAAVSKDLSRIAFDQETGSGEDIRAYDVQLRAQYRIQKEAAHVVDLSWSPDGTRLAYLIDAGATGQRSLRVRSLTGAAASRTVTTGLIGEFAWMANSNEVTLSAKTLVAGNLRSRIYRVNTALPAPLLTATSSIGPATDSDAFLPRPSSDGHQISFLLGEPGSAQVWLMNADGTGATRLTGFDSDSFPYSCRDLRWAA